MRKQLSYNIGWILLVVINILLCKFVLGWWALIEAIITGIIYGIWWRLMERSN